MYTSSLLDASLLEFTARFLVYICILAHYPSWGLVSFLIWGGRFELERLITPHGD